MPSIFHLWNYGSRIDNKSLSMEADRLPAIDGILQTMLQAISTTTSSTTTSSSSTTTAAPSTTTDISAASSHLDMSTTTTAGIIHHANFVWYEDWDDGSDMPPSLPNNPLPPFNRYVELSPLLPFGMMLIISTIIFMLIIFRRWPGLVAGIVAGCLTSMSIYLLLLTLKEQRPVYE